MYVSEQYNVTLDMIHTYIENMSIQNEFSLKSCISHNYLPFMHMFERYFHLRAYKIWSPIQPPFGW